MLSGFQLYCGKLFLFTFLLADRILTHDHNYPSRSGGPEAPEHGESRYVMLFGIAVLQGYRGAALVEHSSSDS